MLHRAVAHAVAGTGGLVLVGGEAGIGKSSLVRLLQDQVGEQMPFLVGACEPLSVPIPLGPLRELAEAAGAADLAELDSDDRLLLMRGLLSALQNRAPAVAVIEDAHWADPLTLDLLRLLARRIERLAIAMVVTFRDDEVGANPSLGQLLGDLATAPAVRRIMLSPLSEAAVTEMADRAGRELGELAAVTGGNPFLVVETLAAHGGVPATVRDAALARASRLRPAARDVVAVAAVIGQRFDFALLEAVAPGSGEAVEEALAGGVLVAQATRLGFRHELIREAIEASISPPRRAELHAQVVTALSRAAGTVDNARLAHHAELGGLAAEASRYARLAADEAARVGALRETRLQAERALRLSEGLSPEERFELLLLYSRATNFASTRLEDAAEAAEQAIALADELGDPVRQGRGLILLAWACWSLDRLPDAKAAAEQAIALLEPTGNVPELARAVSTDVRMEASAFDPQAAIEAGARARALAKESGVEETRIDVEISIALARGHRGERQALAELERTLASAKRAGLTVQVVRAYVNSVVLGVALREHAFVDRVASEALELFDEYGATIPGYALELFYARSLLDRGRWEEALATATRTDRDWVSETPVAWAMQALIRLRRGDPEALTLLEQAWRELEARPEGSRHGLLRCALVEAAWLRDDRGSALAQLRSAGESSAVQRFARTGGELAVWASRLGTKLEPPPGMLAPVSLELEGDWRRAIQAWRELEAPYEAALAALPGDDRSAREALTTLHRLGAAATARAFSRDRAARGERPSRGPRRTTLANPAGLTRREQEVLEQMATGATNHAIAATLHLSERTVAHHVSAILGKLGAHNRLAAVEQARASGLLAQDRQIQEPR